MLKKALSLSMTLAVLTPAAALAQSAGDEQYADPLANQEAPQKSPPTPQSNSGTGNSGQSNSGTGNSGQTTADSTPSSAATAATPAAGAQSQPSASSTLPRTGSTAPVMFAAMGWVLLLTGIVVRRTARPAI